jgi:hypothetical protein
MFFFTSVRTCGREFIRFVRSVLSEADGTGSFSRVAGAAIVLGTLGWVTHVVWHLHTIPDLTGPAAFVTTGVGTLYGVNKASDIIGAFKDTAPPVVPPNPAVLPQPQGPFCGPAQPPPPLFGLPGQH